MNNNINLDEIRKLANTVDVFANCLQQDINQHCGYRIKPRGVCGVSPDNEKCKHGTGGQNEGKLD